MLILAPPSFLPRPQQRWCVQCPAAWLNLVGFELCCCTVQRPIRAHIISAATRIQMHGNDPTHRTRIAQPPPSLGQHCLSPTYPNHVQPTYRGMKIARLAGGEEPRTLHRPPREQPWHYATAVFNAMGAKCDSKFPPLHRANAWKRYAYVDLQTVATKRAQAKMPQIEKFLASAFVPRAAPDNSRSLKGPRISADHRISKVQSANRISTRNMRLP